MDDRRAAEVRGQQKPSNDPRNNQHNLSFPRSQSPVVGLPGLCWLRRMPFVH